MASGPSSFSSNQPETPPAVSLCIICYNQEKYIAEALEGAVLQDYENLEIIVSDDGSTDATPGIIADFQSRYPTRIKALLNPDNVGVTTNCNRALRACSGQFVAFTGGDDVLLPGKIAKQVAWLSADPARVLCAHAVVHMNEDGSRKPDAPEPEITSGTGPVAYIKGGTILPSMTVMVRADAIPAHGFDESISIASDLLFFIEVLAMGGEFGYLPDKLLKYRHRIDSVSTRYFEMLDDIGRTYIIVGERYPEHYKLSQRSLVRHHLYFGAIRYLQVNRKGEARARLFSAIRKEPFYLKAWIRLLQTI